MRECSGKTDQEEDEIGLAITSLSCNLLAAPGALSSAVGADLLVTKNGSVLFLRVERVCRTAATEQGPPLSVFVCACVFLAHALHRSFILGFICMNRSEDSGNYPLQPHQQLIVLTAASGPSYADTDMYSTAYWMCNTHSRVPARYLTKINLVHDHVACENLTGG